MHTKLTLRVKDETNEDTEYNTDQEGDEDVEVDFAKDPDSHRSIVGISLYVANMSSPFSREKRHSDVMVRSVN